MAIHIPRASKVLQATWLTFALESVQKSIIYPLKQWKMCVSEKLVARLRDFWEPNMLYDWLWGIASSLQLRRNLQKLLFTSITWHAVISPLLELGPVMGGGLARGGIVANFSFTDLSSISSRTFFTQATRPLKARPGKAQTPEAEEG